MKMTLRKRSVKNVGYRKNQWNGLRATQAVDQRQQARWSQLAKRCRLAAWVSGWIAGAVVVGWLGMQASRQFGPLLQRSLEIRDVYVEGNYQVTTQTVLDRLALKQGIGLHQVSLPYLAKRLQGEPWIKEAALERMPLHGLRVMIVERKPAAIAKVGTEHVLTDEEGFVLARLGGQDETALPLLIGVDQKTLFQGDRRLRQRIQSSIELAKQMAHSVDGRIEMDFAHPVNLVASAKGVRFHFGNEDLMEQWDRFMKVKAATRTATFEIKGREGSEVDLRYDNRVILRERG